MNDCCTPEASGNVRSYTFLNLNGIPYIHGEYMDRTQIRQIDRSMVRSEVTIQHDNQSRVVVDCSVNDIGLRGTDGLPDVLGNATKQRKLFQMIKACYERLDHTLDVIRGGITLTVEWRLEDATNGYVVSSFQQDFRIPNREYYLDVNPRDLGDNAIICHFADTMVATVNEFAHGHRRLLMRITGISMSYDMLTRDPKNQVRPDVVMRPSVQPLPTCYGTEFDYYYHDKLQPHHMMGFSGCGGCNTNPILPPAWANFNRFYHFDDNGRVLVLHHDEIHDPRCKTMRIPCGRVTMNRLFEVRPGTRVVFRFSIWKNDITVMGDTSEVAHALQAPVADWNCSGHQFCGDINPDNETIIRLLKDTVNSNCQQNRVINNLAAQVDHLQHQLEHMTGNTHCCDHECTCNTPKPVGPVMVGELTFPTAQDAITAIENGTAAGELVLMDDICEKFVVTGKVTINLNGHTITTPKAPKENAYCHTIMVDGGDLTIYGDGNVINENPNSCCVINMAMDDYLNPEGYTQVGIGQGVVTISGGHYVCRGDDPGNVSAPICNDGAIMTINDGVEAVNEQGVFVLYNTPAATMYINGGKFTGGQRTIANDPNGKIIILGGEFTMATPPAGGNQNSDDSAVIANGKLAIIQIAGGKFYGPIINATDDTGAGMLRIVGGTFNADVKEYVPEGYQQKVTGEVVKM